MNNEANAIYAYRVALDTPIGEVVVDLNSSTGPDGAARRAQWSLIASRLYGDVDEVTVISTAVICGWFAGCEAEATGTTAHPALGEVPICDEHAAFAAS